MSPAFSRARSVPMLVLYAVIAVAVVGGTTAYAMLNKTVTLTVEGRTDTIRTFSGTVGDVLEAKDITIRPGDSVNLDLSKSLSDGDHIEVAYAKPVTVALDGSVSEHTVTGTTVGEALRALGVSANSDVYVSRGLYERIPRSGASLVVSSEKDVKITVDGKSTTVATSAPRVSGLLAQAGVRLGPDDEVKPSVDTFLTPGLKVKVTRITTVTKDEKVKIPFEVSASNDSSMLKGETKVVTKGKAGSKLETVTITMADGKVRDRVVHSSKVLSNPVTQVEKRGTNSTAPNSVWDKIAQCESGGNWSINTGNGYYGGLQFSAATWRSVGGPGLPHQHSREVQIKYAKILQARSGWGQWGCAYARFN